MAMDKKKPAYEKGKYTEAKDEKKDAAMLKKRGLTSKSDKAEWKKKDDAHAAKKKPKTMAEDKTIDAKMMNSMAAKKHSLHEKAEGKKGEKAENKREKKMGKK